MRSSILALILGLGGCALGPDYRRPEVAIPEAWRTPAAEDSAVANPAWWRQFDDPVATALIWSAVQENKDLKVAAARIDEFLGRYTTTRAAFLPQIGLNGSADRTRSSLREPHPPPATTANPVNTYRAALGASWQVPLWGRLRRATEAARAELQSTTEARRATLLALVASVASAYVDLRGMDRQLDIVRATARSRADSYALLKLRAAGGITAELDLEQARSEYEGALALIPALEQAIERQENAIGLLLGRNPGPIPRGKPLAELTLPPVPAGLPSALLENRPDIRQAEQDLIAANAQIGLARALYLPSVTLTGEFGWESTQLSNLFSEPAHTWSYAVPVSVPIFSAGSISGVVRSTEARQRQALLRYQETVQRALREVEDALVDHRRTREQLAAQERQAEALRATARAARLLYEGGHTSYLEVLDAERSLLAAELALTQTRGALFGALVAVYSAMGGGWVVEADALSAAE
jgi:outer membrane protein, multidrug efflux system